MPITKVKINVTFVNLGFFNMQHWSLGVGVMIKCGA